MNFLKLSFLKKIYGDIICIYKYGKKVIVQQENAEEIIVAPEIAPLFAETLAKAKKIGVLVLGVFCKVNSELIRLDKTIPAK